MLAVPRIENLQRFLVNLEMILSSEAKLSIPAKMD